MSLILIIRWEITIVNIDWAITSFTDWAHDWSLTEHNTAVVKKKLQTYFWENLVKWSKTRKNGYLDFFYLLTSTSHISGIMIISIQWYKNVTCTFCTHIIFNISQYITYNLHCIPSYTSRPQYIFSILNTITQYHN